MQHLSEYINRLGTLDAASMAHLRTLTERYPYYHAARIIYLRSLHAAHDTAFSGELRRSALYVPSRVTLYNMIEGESLRPQQVSRVSAAERHSTADATDRTDSLISDFLSTLPADKPQRRVRHIDFATDYMGYISQIEGESDAMKSNGQDSASMSGEDHQLELIDVFLGTSGDGRIVLNDRDDAELAKPKLNTENDEQGGIFTEALARIYIKQGKFDKAIEIIRKLSLKYPKKNRYFADQIRFLEKLIINNKNK